MKKFLQLIIVLITYSSFAQKTDLKNAPENPIAIKYKLEHFGFKGDVFSYDYKYYFNKEGLLVEKSNFEGDNTYTYKDGILVSDAASYSIKTNEQGYITFRSLKFNKTDYTYSNKGLLISEVETRNASYNVPEVINIKKYVYDAQNRVVKEDKYTDSILKESTTYSYKKEGNIVKVFKEITKTGKEPYKNENHYLDGRLILAKDQYSDVPLNIVSKLDEKGNSVQDAHVNNGTETDVFDYSIVYYSDANKPINYTMVMFKGNNGKLYQHVHRNGVYFYTDLKTKLENSLDMLLYDDLTQTYYIAKNAYDTSLKEGTVIKFEVLSKGKEALLYLLPNNVISPFYKGQNPLLNATRQNSSLVFDHVFVYFIDRKTNKSHTIFFRNVKDKTFVGGELLPKNYDNIYFFKDSGTDLDAIVKEGVNLNLKTGFSNFKKTQDGSIIGYIKDVPTYTLTNYYITQKDSIYSGRTYNAKIDIIKETSNQQNTSNNSKETSNNTTQNESCISGDCIDGYGEYKFSNGGGTVKGFFTNETLNGYGTLDFANGDNYSGNFVDGKKEGYGIYIWNTSNIQYYGEWKNDKMHGYGYVVTNGETTQAGVYTDSKLTTDLFIDYKNGKVTGDNCLGNCTNGFGSLQYDNGNVYTGIFINGKSTKVGSLKWKKFNSFYVGQFDANEQTHGTGMYVNTSYIYFGNITNGALTGKAVKTDKITGKDTYGEFKDGILIKDYSLKENKSSNTTTNTTPTTTCVSGNCTEGFGELKTSQSTITGFFSGGKANGYGKEVYADGSGFYQGKFESGMRGGFGMYTWNKDGQYYIGEWKEGKQHGYGYFKKGGDVFQAGFYENGKQIRNMLTQNYMNKYAVGNCVGDCTNGFGYYKYSDSSVYVGFFTNGQINNIGAYTWNSGDAFIGNIINGQFSGQGTIYYKSAGTTYYGNLSNGVRQGMGVYFNKSGGIESKGYWDNGVLKTPY